MATQTIFGDSQPIYPQYTGAQAYVLGQRFSTDAAGSITAARFFYTASMNVAHEVALYDIYGNKLAGGVFSPNILTSEGWKVVTFDTPVNVEPYTDFIVCGTFPNGTYLQQSPFAGKDVRNLHASATSGYYSPSVNMVFPAASGSYAFAVDIVFSTDQVAPAAIPSSVDARIASRSNLTISDLNLALIGQAITVAMANGQFSCEIFYRWSDAEIANMIKYLALGNYRANCSSWPDTIDRMMIQWD